MTDDIEYLSITIHATCSVCGKATENAEAENWKTDSTYTKIWCPECNDAKEEVV